MIALGIRYLTKRSVAADLAQQRPEWPPHPGRVFMAMAAAHFETGADGAERKALEWIESAPAPALRASGADDRSPVRAYVPVNDDHGGIVRRGRQERAFPSTRPHEDQVFLIWDYPAASDTRAALEGICGKVTRIGHSSSAVQMWVVPQGTEPTPNLMPNDRLEGPRLRVARPGALQMLETAFNGREIEHYDAMEDAIASAKGRQKTALKTELRTRFPGGHPESKRPQLVTWQGYGTAEAGEGDGTTVDGPFDAEFVVLSKIEGPTLGLESTLQLTGALRCAAMKAAGEAPPAWLTGHDADGKPSKETHVAFFPLPYAGFPHADGHVLGLGMAIPRGLPNQEELRRHLGPLLFDTASGRERRIRLWNTNVWDWTVEREVRERPPLALQRISWTRASRAWASVTPVVLHHHPKRRDGDVERIVRDAFVSALLPEPDEVEVRSISRVEGAGHSMSMPTFAEGGGNLCRYQTHVTVRFAQRVRGPVLVGRGRYRGYGLFRPLAEES
jgi:CRISPR-associated protein Csb2